MGRMQSESVTLEANQIAYPTKALDHVKRCGFTLARSPCLCEAVKYVYLGCHKHHRVVWMTVRLVILTVKFHLNYVQYSYI